MQFLDLDNQDGDDASDDVLYVGVCVLDKDMEHGRGGLGIIVDRRGSPGQNAQS